jgi:glycerol-3-phosphate dehydrogenase
VTKCSASCHSSTRENLTGAVRYFDGFTNDARLVLDTPAFRHRPRRRAAQLRAAEKPERDGDVWRVRIQDRLNDSSVEVRTKNSRQRHRAWPDLSSASEVKLRLTKGVHLVIDRSRAEHSRCDRHGRRVANSLAIPWGERVILGTTDTDYSGPLTSPTCGPEDIRYIWASPNTRSLRHGSPPKTSSVRGRAFVAHRWRQQRAGQAIRHLRAHQIRMPQRLAGSTWRAGKLTTYRLMAEQRRSTWSPTSRSFIQPLHDRDDAAAAGTSCNPDSAASCRRLFRAKPSSITAATSGPSTCTT